jgi:hypothetical protein
VAPTQASAIGHCHVSGAQFDIGQLPPWPSPNKAIALQSLFCRRRHGGPSNHGYLDIGSARSRSGFVRLAVLVFHHPIPFIAFGNSYQRHHHPAVFESFLTGEGGDSERALTRSYAFIVR